VAAVGLGGGITVWFPYTILNGTLNSVNTFVAQRFGAGDRAGCVRFAWQGIYLGFLGLIPAILIASFAVPLYAALTSPDVAALSADYSRIRVFAVAAFSFIMVFECFWRGLGDTKTPMRITVGANVLNIVATYVLMFGPFGLPRLGVVGAAWGTLLAQLSALGCHVWLFARESRRGLFQTLPPAPLSRSALRRLLWVGYPVGLTWFLDMGSFTIFTVYVGTFGTIALAVTTIVIQIQSLSFMQMIAVGQAGTTLVGQYIGAGRHEIALRSGRSAIRVGFFYGVAVGILFILARTEMIGVFNREMEVIRMGSVVLLYSAAMQFFDGVWIVAQGSLRGAGDTRFSLWMGMLLAWGIFLPLTFGLGSGLGLGIHGAWSAMVVWAFLGCITHVPRFLRARWRHIEI
jgi:putative MATE family efflux protein